MRPRGVWFDSLQLTAAQGLVSLCRPRRCPAASQSALPVGHLPGAQMHREPPSWSTGERQPRPFALSRPPCPMPPAKHRTFLRVQLSDRQAHGQTHRHSHALTPSETASQSTFVSQSQSHSTCERPGQEEGEKKFKFAPGREFFSLSHSGFSLSLWLPPLFLLLPLLFPS